MSEQSHTPFHTEGIVTNPAGGVLLATSGPLPEGVHTFSIFAGCTVNTRVNFVWRDALSVSKHTQPIFVVASNTFMHAHPSTLSIPCDEGDTFTLETAISITGSVAGTLCVA